MATHVFSLYGSKTTKVTTWTTSPESHVLVEVSDINMLTVIAIENVKSTSILYLQANNFSFFIFGAAKFLVER